MGTLITNQISSAVMGTLITNQMAVVRLALLQSPSSGLQEYSVTGVQRDKSPCIDLAPSATMLMLTTNQMAAVYLALLQSPSSGLQEYSVTGVAPHVAEGLRRTAIVSAAAYGPESCFWSGLRMLQCTHGPALGLLWGAV